MEKKIRCAFSGKKGAYAEIAVKNYFGDKAEALAVNGFEEIFQNVLDGNVDYGMVPIENTTTGSVYQNYDNFVKFTEISIVASISIKIEHALLAPEGASLQTIKNVYSHPQGLYQCLQFLNKHPDWVQVDTVSTSDGAKIVSDLSSVENAAIANAKNAELYKLKVLQNGIQDVANNFTRFFVIAKNENAVKHGHKATFIFTTKNQPGALYYCLGVFKDAGLNLIHIESRPILGKPWSYRFFANVEFDEKADVTKKINDFMEKIKSVTEEIRLLGLYSEVL